MAFCCKGQAFPSSGLPGVLQIAKEGFFFPGALLSPSTVREIELAIDGISPLFNFLWLLATLQLRRKQVRNSPNLIWPSWERA